MRGYNQTDRNRKAAKEFSCRQHPSPRSLQPQEPNNSLTSRDAQSHIIRTEDRARSLGMGRFMRRIRKPHLDDHCPNLHGASGPREQATNPCCDFHPGSRKIQATIVFCEAPAVRSGSVILLDELQGSVGQPR